MDILHFDYEKVHKENGTAIALGNFDGLHLGHKKIMETLSAVAKENGLFSVVYTFLEHPLNVIGKNGVLPLIADSETKAQLIENCNVDALFFEDFQKIRNLEPEAFVKQILIDKLNCKAVVVGKNNRFGKNSQGDTALLKTLGEKYGFFVCVVDFVYKDDIVCSSTKIREYVLGGEIKKANRLLGYNFTVCGVVKKGKELGHSLGFPTANFTAEKTVLLPKCGVYATKTLIGDRAYKSLTNVGTAPSLEDFSVHLETHILDFDGDLYGKRICCEFLFFMRDIITFENVEKLKEQVQSDILKIKETDLL